MRASRTFTLSGSRKHGANSCSRHARQADDGQANDVGPGAAVAFDEERRLPLDGVAARLSERQLHRDATLEARHSQQLFGRFRLAHHTAEIDELTACLAVGEFC